MDASIEVEWDHPLPATKLLIASVLIAHVAGGLFWYLTEHGSLYEGVMLARPESTRLFVGGQLAERIHEEPWRLVSSIWVHVDWVHLGVNAIALWVLGRLLEPWIGSLRWLTLFVVSGTFASWCSYLAGLARSDGASGGCFGRLGALLILAIRHRGRIHTEDWPMVGPYLWACTVINLVLSLWIPIIDVVGHTSGLLMGALVGLFLSLER